MTPKSIVTLYSSACPETDDPDNPSQENIEKVMQAIMSMLGIMGCTPAGRDGTGLLSGNCNPIDENPQTCAGAECARLVNQQSLCAIITETFGRVMRNCDSARTDAADPATNTKIGGCNALKYVQPADSPGTRSAGFDIPCDVLRQLAITILGYMTAINCINYDLSASSGSHVEQTINFSLKNSICKGGITLGGSYKLTSSDNIVQHFSTRELGEATLDVVRQVVEFIKNHMASGLPDIEDVCGEVIAQIDAMGEGDKVAYASSIADGVNHMFATVFQTININIINTIVNGKCEATQDLVLDFSVQSLIDISLNSMSKYVPALDSLPDAINGSLDTVPTSADTGLKQWWWWIALAVLLVVVLVVVVIAVAGKRRRAAATAST